jgi:hypothetical protein
MPENTRNHLGRRVKLIKVFPRPHFRLLCLLLIFFAYLCSSSSLNPTADKSPLWISPTTVIFNTLYNYHPPRQRRMATIALPRTPIMPPPPASLPRQLHTRNNCKRNLSQGNHLILWLWLLRIPHTLKPSHLRFARPRTNTHIISIPSRLARSLREPLLSTTSFGCMPAPASPRLAQNSP